jgi:hypothetical protein
MYIAHVFISSNIFKIFYNFFRTGSKIVMGNRGMDCRGSKKFFENSGGRVVTLSGLFGSRL